MNDLFRLVILTVFCIETSSSSSCPVLNETQGCYCGTPTNPSGSGWELSCYDFNATPDVNVVFSITQRINKYLKIDCNENHDFSYENAELFDYLGKEEFHQVRFSKCPPLTKSVSELFKGHTITQLTFSSSNYSGSAVFDESVLSGLSKLTDLNFRRGGIGSISERALENLTKLGTLVLSGNNIGTLPENLFSFTPSLTALDLASNNFERLPNTLFRNVSNLKRLYLHNNKLEVLSPQLFEGLRKLETLDMRKNLLTFVPADLFADLTELNRTALGLNKLTTLPAELFQNNKKLQIINLSGNKFRQLPKNLLEGLKNLKFLHMMDCNMSNIDDDFFAAAENLEYVNLRNNRIAVISSSLFTRNKNLKYVHLELNNLRNLTGATFRKLYKLEQLFLNRNKIDYISADAFADLTSLKLLRLDRNRLADLPFNLFVTLANVEKLDVSYNVLNLTYSTSRFSHMIKLQDLNLRRNKLTYVPEVSILVQIENVDLRYNNIEMIFPARGVSDGTRFRLENNKIMEVDMSLVKAMIMIYRQEDVFKNQLTNHGKPTAFYLNNNPIACDCRIVEFLTYMKKTSIMLRDKPLPVRFYVSNLKCSSPPSFSGRNVIELEPNEPTCKVENCPEGCLCALRTYNRSVTVDCNDVKLNNLPDVLPFNTSILKLQNTSINEKHLIKLSSRPYENVTQLNLADNDIMFMREENLPPKLKFLDIRHGKLKAMPDWLPSNSRKKKKLHYLLGNNPWVCDCKTRQFKSWLTQNHKRIGDIKNITCHYENGTLMNTKNKTLIFTSDEDLCKFSDESARQLMISAITATVIIAILIVIIAILYYKQKQNIIVFMFSHNMCQFFFKEDDLDEDKLFDAFVSYSHHNRDFVIKQLLPELEQKNPKYNLCIHERNFIPGTSIVENIINAIELSRRTVIILSKDFVQSDWGMLEFSIAHHQMLKDYVNRVVVIMMDELHVDEVQKELKFFLSTKTYLKKDELWFWDKLRYAMPRQPLSIKNKDGPLLNMPNIEQRKKLKPKILEVRDEINKKIVKEIKDSNVNNQSDYSSTIAEKKLGGLLNPVFNDSNVQQVMQKQSVIQMEPIGRTELVENGKQKEALI